ncbi:MAG: hypothetical protein HOP18_04610 [Deltaproteobacteria bacterium]|nr:hypothetical protein [Deltaproteobacteria bacterium]
MKLSLTSRATASRPRWVCEDTEEPRAGRSRCAGALDEIASEAMELEVKRP